MKNWFLVLVPFSVSRLVILLIFFFVSQAHIFGKYQAWEVEVFNPHVELGSRDIVSNLAPILSSGDARWYLDIAKHGYDFSDPTIIKMRNWVFFPLVPLLINLLSKVVASKLLAGLILSNLCFLLFLKVLLEICREERIELAESERLIWFTCFFPERDRKSVV